MWDAVLVTLGFLTQVCLLLGVRVLSLLWSSRNAQGRLFCGDPSAPPYTLPRLHQGPDSSPLGWASVGPFGNMGAARRFWLLQSLRSLLRWKMDWLLGVGGAWASPCGLSRKGKCGQSGTRCSEVGGRPVGEERLSSAVPEPQHLGHCCPLRLSHIDPLATQVSI